MYLGPRRVDLFYIHSQLLQCFLCALGFKLAIPGQSRERCACNRLRVDLKMPAEVLAIVAAAETIGAQGYQTPAQPRRQLVRHRLYEIRGCDDRSFGFGLIQRRDDIGLFLLLSRMQAVPTLNGQRLTTEFVVAGYAPHVRLHAIFLGQNALRAQGLIQDWATAEQLRAGLAAWGVLVFVQAPDNALTAALRHLGHGVIFVVEQDVIETVFALLIHAA